jgi:uncharacterized protein
MTHTVTPLDVDSTSLDEKLLAPPSAHPLSGDILVRGRVEFATGDRSIISGIWESDPGTSRWEFSTRGEIVHILAGRMRVAEDGGEPVELVAGSVAYFPIGWNGTWEIIEPVRKLYVVYK